jgi:hypothetical protein
MLALSALLWPAVASEQTFPFDRDLMLDVVPKHGSKRVPILEIAENGDASINLWCASARARAEIAEDSITIVAGQIKPAPCPMERIMSDNDLLVALTQVTSWRRRGDVIELLGATTLRFRVMTN